MQRQKGEATSFGKEIKRRLVDKDMTQRELAELLGMNYKYLHRIIYGYRNGKKYIAAIGEALDIVVGK